MNDQLEEQRQEQALQRYRCEADELDSWLLSTKATLDTALGTPKEPMDMEAQLVDCQVPKDAELKNIKTMISVESKTCLGFFFFLSLFCFLF